MKNLNLKEKGRTLHFKEYSKKKVRELGIDGAVQYFRNQIEYYQNNKIYEQSSFYIFVCELSIEYIVNDLAE